MCAIGRGSELVRSRHDGRVLRQMAVVDWNLVRTRPLASSPSQQASLSRPPADQSPRLDQAFVDVCYEESQDP